MNQTTVLASGVSAELSLPQRVLGVITSPTPTFEAIVASPKPKWLDVWLVTTLIVFGAQIAFALTEVGRRATVDYQVVWAERFGAQVNNEQYNQMLARAANPVGIIVGNSIGLVAAFLIFLLICGVIMGVFAVMGGQTSFRHIKAVVAHTGAVQALAVLFVTPLNYARETMTSATNLGVFAQMLPEESFVARFLGAIDLIWVWYLIILAIGLGALYRRKASSIAYSFLGLYLVIALIIAGVRSALGGS
jgi:hypothetical protein